MTGRLLAVALAVLAAVAAPAVLIASPTGPLAPTCQASAPRRPAALATTSASTGTPPEPVSSDDCAPAPISAAGWTAPAPGPVGSGFRTRQRPGHAGVDILAARHTLIRAAAAGVVTVAVCDSSTGTCDVDGSPAVRGCGWYVDIAHGAGITTRYCHMVARPLVAVGQSVAAGQPLGRVGSSGNSSGPHLHFETHRDGTAVDPTAFLAARGVALGADR